MSVPSPSLGLDETVFPLRERLRRAGVSDPEALFLMATGVGFLPTRLTQRLDVELGEMCGECAPWGTAVLVTGRLGPLSAWFLEDLSGEPLLDEPAPAWMRALPVWLAAAAGARVCVHTSAGTALCSELHPPTLALLTDHLNFTATSPLVGLGESKLGPLFPDLSRLYPEALRRAAVDCARTLGIGLVPAIAACTLGPALETRAERLGWARLGADIAVPNLAAPLLAAAHAGLGVLGLVAVPDAGEDPSGALESTLSAARVLQPALEDLLQVLAPELSAWATAEVEA